MAWTPQNVFKVRELVISDKKQSAYGTVLPDVNFTQRLLFDGGAFPQITKAFRSDIEKAGKGHAYPTRRVETDRNASFQMATDVDAWIAGWLAAFCMGSVATVGVGPYTHTIKFQDPGDLPVTSLYFENTAALKRRLVDMSIAQVEFSGTGRGLVQASFSMMGSGKHTDGAIAPGLPALPTITEILGSDLTMLIGAPGAAAAFDSDRILQWRVTLSNGCVTHRGPGSTLYATKNKMVTPRASVSLTLSEDSVDALDTLFMANTERELQLNINSGAAAQLKFKFPHIYFSGSSAGASDNEVVRTIENDEQALLKVGADEYVEVTVINGQATYATAAA